MAEAEEAGETKEGSCPPSFRNPNQLAKNKDPRPQNTLCNTVRTDANS